MDSQEKEGQKERRNGATMLTRAYSTRTDMYVPSAGEILPRHWLNAVPVQRRLIRVQHAGRKQDPSTGWEDMGETELSDVL